MESSTSMDASDNLSNGILVQHCNNVEVSENLGVEILKDFDSYVEDIEDRLTVSRMVSDSVIKGMICAVEQEAVEKIAQKDSELDRLKETLRLYHVSSDDNESLRYSVKLHKPKSRIFEFYSTNSSGIVDRDKLPDFLVDLKFVAKEQFKKLETEIDKIKVSPSMGLSHILPENMPDKWIHVDRALDGLRTTLESICGQSEKMVCVSKSFIFDWEQEREFQAEIEGMVIKNCIQSLQEEFEQKLWDRNSQSSANESADWLEKIKEISSLRQELDTISKSLSVPESGQLLSYGSLEHQKASGDHVSSPPWEGNGKHDESVIVVPENLEHAQLKHLSKEKLFNYLKAEMTKMKRHHELQLREKTEQYYSLKRVYLNARGSSLPVKKDKELDSFRKKIPDVILKLDNILTEIQKLPSFSNNGDSLDNLKDRLESLRLENQQLRDLLMDKKKEIKHLYSKVSNESENILQHSFAEENLSRTLKNLEWTMEDVKVEASISQDLYKFLLKEVLRQMEGLNEELNMEYDIILAIYKNILKEATDNAAPFNKLEIEDLVIESTVIQGICEIIFRESFKEAEEKVGTWSQKYIDENKVRMSLEMEALEKDNSLRCNIAEKKKLEEEMISLRAMLDDKDKSVQEAADAWAKENEKLELASQELDNLRAHSIQQDIIILIYDEELQIVRSDLAEALEKVEVDKGQISQLSEQLEIVKQNLRGVVKEKNMLHSICQVHENTLSLVEAREKEHMKQMNSTIILVEGLSKVLTNFECKATEDIKMNSLRLGNLSSQFISLIQKANRMRRTELLYKQRLESRCSDLQKAEAEVDLLGDEVDALLSLLEKIYIALDHYSPILQHYPGVVEILKLVRRELSGESVKSV